MSENGQRAAVEIAIASVEAGAGEIPFWMVSKPWTRAVRIVAGSSHKRIHKAQISRTHWC